MHTSRLNHAEESARIGAIAADVAAHLDGFTPVPREESHSAARIRADDGRELVFRFDGSTDKVRVTGTWPREWSRSYTGTVPGIGVGTAKGAQRMARDIARRLLPLYAEEFARARGLAQAAERERVERAALAVELAKLAGCEVSANYPNEFRWLPAGSAYGEVEIGHGQVTVKLRALTPEQARRVAALIGDL